MTVATASVVEPGYWTLAQLADYMQVSRWTISRRVKAEPGFPGAARGSGPDRYPVERVKAYLQRQEQSDGAPDKTHGPAPSRTTWRRD